MTRSSQQESPVQHTTTQASGAQGIALRQDCGQNAKLEKMRLKSSRAKHMPAPELVLYGKISDQTRPHATLWCHLKQDRCAGDHCGKARSKRSLHFADMVGSAFSAPA